MNMSEWCLFVICVCVRFVSVGVVYVCVRCFCGVGWVCVVCVCV